MLKYLSCLIVLLAMLAGCSGLIAKPDMAAVIDSQSALAATALPAAKAGTISDADARAQLAANATTFAKYADTKTVNFFAYIFDPAKQIFVNGEYATRLDRGKLLSAETAGRCSTQPTAWLNRAVAGESKVLMDISDARQGKVGAP